MSRIIAGRFQTSEQADQAVRMLEARSIGAGRVSVFYVTPPGQHDATPVGGDEAKSPGLEGAGSGAGTGAAAGLAAGAIGALVGATAGLAAPVIAVAGLGAAAAGAYGGSLAGAMGASTDAGAHRVRHAGMMVAVDAGDARAEVVSALRESGALDLEEVDGVWANGTWDDFDPTEPPALIEVPAESVSNPAGH